MTREPEVLEIVLIETREVLRACRIPPPRGEQADEPCQSQACDDMERFSPPRCVSLPAPQHQDHGHPTQDVAGALFPLASGPSTTWQVLAGQLRGGAAQADDTVAEGSLGRRIGLHVVPESLGQIALQSPVGFALIRMRA